jgi:hypothetical protein
MASVTAMVEDGPEGPIVMINLELERTALLCCTAGTAS